MAGRYGISWDDRVEISVGWKSRGKNLGGGYAQLAAPHKRGFPGARATYFCAGYEPCARGGAGSVGGATTFGPWLVEGGCAEPSSGFEGACDLGAALGTWLVDGGRVAVGRLTVECATGRTMAGTSKAKGGNATGMWRLQR